MRLEILDLAQVDLLEGYRFYERQEERLGDYFLASLYADIESLRLYAGTHRQTYRGYYRLLSARFPFAIYYTMDAGVAQIRAIVDCRRNPSWIRIHLIKA